MAVTEVKYVNESSRDLHVVKWVNHAFRVIDNEDTPAFWSFQGQSTIDEPIGFSLSILPSINVTIWE